MVLLWQRLGWMTNNITINGDVACPSGVYMLRIKVAAPLSVSFGRFRGGRPVAVAAGDYLYVGSAMGRGAVSPAGRLLRHATRSGNPPPHSLRDALLDALRGAGLATPASARIAPSGASTAAAVSSQELSRPRIGDPACNSGTIFPSGAVL